MMVPLLKHSAAIAAAAVISLSVDALGQAALPLLGEDGDATEEVLEALLAPGDFVDRRFEYISEGDEARFAIDSSLGAKEPFAQLAPERLEWPRVAGLEMAVNDHSLKLKPARPGVDDRDLDEDFAVRWILEAVGQRFTGDPAFEMRVTGAQVFSVSSGEVLLQWSEPPARRICAAPAGDGPECDLDGVGKEARAVSVSPDGERLALALGGLKPRVEIYELGGEPRLSWKAFFPGGTGGVVQVSFSTDGRWVVALTGEGRMHRFDAETGGEHLAIPSSGRTARAIPPGRVIAVAGESGEVTLWYLADGTIAWRLPPRKLRGPVDRLAPSGDGRRFATLEYDEEGTVVRIWETHRRAMLAQVQVDSRAVNDIALDAEGERLFVAHEREGLMSVAVGRKAGQLVAVDGPAAGKCTDRLQWIPEEGLLTCASGAGVLKVTPGGELVERFSTGIDSSDWLVAVAGTGARTAVVGEGHLLLWRRDIEGEE